MLKNEGKKKGRTGEIEFKVKSINKDKETHHLMIKK